MILRGLLPYEKYIHENHCDCRILFDCVALILWFAGGALPACGAMISPEYPATPQIAGHTRETISVRALLNILAGKYTVHFRSQHTVWDSITFTADLSGASTPRIPRDVYRITCKFLVCAKTVPSEPRSLSRLLGMLATEWLPRLSHSIPFYVSISAHLKPDQVFPSSDSPAEQIT